MSDVDAATKLLALLAVRDAQDSFERAIGWTVRVGHEDDDGRFSVLHGTFSEPAAALEWAQTFEAGLNEDGEDGFRCTVLPIMPAL
jgi:hypothetical protein